MRLAAISRERVNDTNRTLVRGATPGLSEMGFLRRWLYLANFRSESAPLVFVAASIAAALAGLGAALSIQVLGITAFLTRGVDAIPGGVGQIFLPLAILFPWVVGVLLSVIPLVVVRAARRRRVQLVDQDLPLALELLATLSEAGIGFDSALSRILTTRLAHRPLAHELQTFQADLLAGRPRVHALRRLSQRLQISAVSVFVSALVQADQIGMGIAGVLRRQADDMRGRRREQANAFAAALPVKRMFPLVVCFLPGIFIWTLGPFFVQLFKIADSFIQIRNF
jgi:tight adherence protein C